MLNFKRRYNLQLSHNALVVFYVEDADLFAERAVSYCASDITVEETLVLYRSNIQVVLMSMSATMR